MTRREGRGHDPETGMAIMMLAAAVVLVVVAGLVALWAIGPVLP